MSSDYTMEQLNARALDWERRQKLEKHLRVHFNPVVTAELMDKYPVGLLEHVCLACERSPLLDRAVLHAHAKDFNIIMNKRRVILHEVKREPKREDWSVRIRKLRARRK